jgi:hypothetical protein
MELPSILTSMRLLKTASPAATPKAAEMPMQRILTSSRMNDPMTHSFPPFRPEKASG